jgi:DNA (cytosine-5)-methyltransferase 1
MGHTFTFIDLFAGIGGFHLGATSHGGVCITACELNPEGRAIYAANHKVRNNAIHDDIYTLMPVKNADLVCAGFPCQSHSTLGKRRGLHDKRGKLFVQLCTFIKASKPRAFLLENVKGLMSSTDFEKSIIKPLEECGYSVSWSILDAKNFGVPQHRERVFIVGRRVSAGKTQAINTTPFSFKSLATQMNHKTINNILDAKYKDVYEKEHLECTIFDDAEMFKTPHETSTGFVLRAQLSNFTNRKLFSSNGIVGTLATSSPPPIYDEKHKIIRHLTKKELKACQGFPASFKFPPDMSRSDVVYYLGNAVCVRVISAIVKEMLQQNVI